MQIGLIASRRLENPETATEHFLGFVWKSPFGSIIGFCRGFFPVRLASLHCLGEPHSLRIAWSSTCPLLDQSDANHELRWDAPGPTTSFSDYGTWDLYSDVSQSPRIQRMIYTWIDSKDTSWHHILLPIFQFAVSLQRCTMLSRHKVRLNTMKFLRRNIWLRDAGDFYSKSIQLDKYG